ncbi:uncharacterized protein LOC132607907 [Lycium barbarum]|uniref:uncharacterized protein LOC132607907 n=1 Tax=Lycium barbarum TaxID=112863 RepID=UPI00293EF320|nr:uncharacterized protein LOC132607907 [Lycium barbarum]
MISLDYRLDQQAGIDTMTNLKEVLIRISYLGRKATSLIDNRGGLVQGRSEVVAANSATNNIENPRLSEYNFKINLARLVAAIGKIEGAKWPRPMQSDPSQRNLNLLCDYHGTQGHRTSDCHYLRDEVARLLKDGHLREFLSDRAKENYGNNRDSSKQEVQVELHLVINMITDEPMDTRMSFSIKKDKLSEAYDQRAQGLMHEVVVSFTNEEAKDLISPHPDTLVIYVMINHYRITDVVIDRGSSTNVIQWGVIEQLAMMGKLTPFVRVFNGFSEASKTTKGQIELPVNTGGVIKKIRGFTVTTHLFVIALLT